MKRLPEIIGLLLLVAACNPPPSKTGEAPAQPVAAKPAVPIQATPAAGAPRAETSAEPLTRWRGVPSTTGLAAVFGPARSDDSSYRMECRDSVLTVWVFHEEPAPPGRAAGELILRKATGKILVRSSADAEPDDLGTRLVFNLPQDYLGPGDGKPGLQLGIALPGEAAGWTELNDVARDILAACAAA